MWRIKATIARTNATAIIAIKVGRRMDCSHELSLRSALLLGVSGGTRMGASGEDGRTFWATAYLLYLHEYERWERKLRMGGDRTFLSQNGSYWIACPKIADHATI